MSRNKKEEEDATPSGRTEEEIRIHIWDGIPFYFDPNALQFILGPKENPQKLELEDFANRMTLSKLLMEQKRPISPDDSEPLYMIISSGLVELPSFRRGLSELAQNPGKTLDVMKKVEAVMSKTYQKIDPSAVLPRKRIRERSANWMEIRASADTNGYFRLQTFGNCACLEHDPGGHGVFVPRLYPPDTDLDIPLVYSSHNADTDAERISLYAGAGALAFLIRNG